MMKKWLAISIIVMIFSSCEEEEKGEVEWGSGVCYFEELEPEFESCFSLYNESTLEIATWNMKLFPLSGSTTIDLAAKVIQNMDADIIALQEITDRQAFSQLVTKMPGWHGEYMDISGDLDLAFLYKICEITSVEGPEIIEDTIWPRPGIETTITHTNGMKLTLINVHLKCCGGSENRSVRQSAAEKLKEHVDRQHSEDALIILGDFNDEILSGSPFLNFIEDREHYEFADIDIAYGSDADWSYPSFPSHIDHILITDELFSSVTRTQIIKLEICIDKYQEHLSDHRPLLMSLRP